MTPQYGTSLTGAGDVATICHIIRPDDKTRTLCGARVAWRFGKGEDHAGWNLCQKCEAIAGPVEPAEESCPGGQEEGGQYGR